MQVKKFEAPTLQEALDTIKRELGPEAIILQTKQNRRGFGLMSKGSVEVTAAVSERAVEKKTTVEKRIPDGYRQKLTQASASKQADIYDSFLEKKIDQERVQLSSGAAATKKITAVRYADIADHDHEIKSPVTVSIPEIQAPEHLHSQIEAFGAGKDSSLQALQEEVTALKKLVEELKRERKKPDYIDSDSPFLATDALEGAYHTLIQGGLERRHSVELMRQVARNLKMELRGDHDAVLDQVADELLKNVDIASIFSEEATASPEIHAFIGPCGSGKTALIAKLGTHCARNRHEKIGIIRVQPGGEDAVDPLVIFSKAIHVPYRLVTSAEELQVAIQDMSQCHRLFVDTTGVSSRDVRAIKALNEVLSGVRGLKTCLVVSALVRDQELRDQGKMFSVLNPGSLVFTHLDEALTVGNIYSLSKHLGLPLAVFSSGKKVTEQWEVATAERLTASILNIL